MTVNLLWRGIRGLPVPAFRDRFGDVGLGDLAGVDPVALAAAVGVAVARLEAAWEDDAPEVQRGVVGDLARAVGLRGDQVERVVGVLVDELPVAYRIQNQAWLLHLEVWRGVWQEPVELEGDLLAAVREVVPRNRSVTEHLDVDTDLVEDMDDPIHSASFVFDILRRRRSLMALVAVTAEADIPADTRVGRALAEARELLATGAGQ